MAPQGNRGGVYDRIFRSGQRCQQPASSRRRMSIHSTMYLRSSPCGRRREGGGGEGMIERKKNGSGTRGKRIMRYEQWRGRECGENPPKSLGNRLFFLAMLKASHSFLASAHTTSGSDFVTLFVLYLVQKKRACTFFLFFIAHLPDCAALTHRAQCTVSLANFSPPPMHYSVNGNGKV